MLRKTFLSAFVAALTTPLFALAAPSKSPLSLQSNTLPRGPYSLLDMIAVVGNWLFTILLVLAVIFLLLAAFNYMGGNEERVAKAHRMLIYTAISVAVAMLAIGIVSAVQIFVTSPTGQF